MHRSTIKGHRNSPAIVWIQYFLFSESFFGFAFDHTGIYGVVHVQAFLLFDVSIYTGDFLVLSRYIE